jgi:hypothetical protein
LTGFDLSRLIGTAFDAELGAGGTFAAGLEFR